MKFMIYMDLETEKLGGKRLQFFPLTTSLIPGYFNIDTSVLVEMFAKPYEKKNLNNNINVNQHSIWSKYFRIEEIKEIDNIKNTKKKKIQKN